MPLKALLPRSAFLPHTECVKQPPASRGSNALAVPAERALLVLVNLGFILFQMSSSEQSWL